MKSPMVELTEELIAKCEKWAAETVAYYRNNGKHPHTMPLTLDLMSHDELRRWLASREEAGRDIDIETCELGRWKAYDCDPYGILSYLGELPEEMQQVGTNRFVRSPQSNGWVNEGDLPTASAEAMYDRIHREWEAYCRANPDDPRVQSDLAVTAAEKPVTLGSLAVCATPWHSNLSRKNEIECCVDRLNPPP
jgi:hypothetical protein